MPVLVYVLIFLITACGPQKPPQEQEQATPPPSDETTTRSEDPQAKQTEEDSPPPPSTTDPATPSENQPSGENSDNEVTSPPPVVDNTSPPVNQNPPPVQKAELPPPISEEQAISNALHQIQGTYVFLLDAHQTWMTLFASDALTTLNLALNPRPQAQQMLIEAISPDSPVGKFCVIQSNFTSERRESSRQSSQIIALSALHSIPNEGQIADISNVEDTLKINTHEPFTFTLKFYGEHGAESVKFNADDKSEGSTPNFDLLCQSCGFEVKQSGLCQAQN